MVLRYAIKGRSQASNVICGCSILVFSSSGYWVGTDPSPVFFRAAVPQGTVNIHLQAIIGVQIRKWATWGPTTLNTATEWNQSQPKVVLKQAIAREIMKLYCTTPSKWTRAHCKWSEFCKAQKSGIGLTKKHQESCAKSTSNHFENVATPNFHLRIVALLLRYVLSHCSQFPIPAKVDRRICDLFVCFLVN